MWCSVSTITSTSASGKRKSGTGRSVVGVGRLEESLGFHDAVGGEFVDDEVHEAELIDRERPSMRTVRRYIADGQLEAVRLSRETLRIKIDSIERFVDARPVGNWR